MRLKPGQKLRSAVCDAEVVIVKAPAGEVELGCGGAPLVPDGEDAPTGAALDESLGDGPLMGKRYADEAIGLELLCTRPGKGALVCNGEPLPIKGAKPLPASD